MITGDFNENDNGFSWRLFVILMTFVINLILIHLIVALMSDSYTEVITSMSEYNQKFLAYKIIMYYENLLFWRRLIYSKMCLIWIDYLDLTTDIW